MEQTERSDALIHRHNYLNLGSWGVKFCKDIKKSLLAIDQFWDIRCLCPPCMDNSYKNLLTRKKYGLIETA